VTHWEQIEEWLFETRPNGGTFLHGDVMERFDLDGRTATLWIQSYLDAQRQAKSRTLYVIHREQRTSRAIWVVGVRAVDARAIGHQFFDDVHQRFVIAVTPDLERLATINPRAAKRCRRIIEVVGTNAMQLLRVAVDGVTEDE